MKQTKNKDCCKVSSAGFVYGFIPHIGCIAFIIGSIFGVTVLMKFFRPLLMNRYFFDVLILVSLAFATLSSFLYLRNNGLLSFTGIRKKWKYLATMYGSTIGVNLVLFMLIFPLLANVSPSVAADTGSLSEIKLKVDIPCPGHAPLITNELKTLSGVKDVRFSFPNNFDVRYDAAETTQLDILSLEVFRTYKATVS